MTSLSSSRRFPVLMDRSLDCAVSTVTSVTSSETYCTITFGDLQTSRFHFFWLRDNCRCPTCYHPVTSQRLYDTVNVEGVTALSTEVVSGALSVSWSDGHQSTYTGAFLREFAYDLQGRNPQNKIDLSLWSGDDMRAGIRKTASISYEEALQSDAGMLKLLEIFREFGVIFVQGVPATAQETEAFVKKIGLIRHTLWGGFWETNVAPLDKDVDDVTRNDLAYSTVPLGAHTDCTYLDYQPVIQMFHSILPAAEGGDSLIVDSFWVAAKMKREYPKEYDILSTIEVEGRFLDNKHDLRARRTVFRHDKNGSLVQVSFNNQDRSVVVADFDMMPEFYRALNIFNALLREAQAEYWEVLKPCTLMIFDNWRVMHGRASFDPTSGRHLVGAYMDSDEILSRINSLRSKLAAKN